MCCGKELYEKEGELKFTRRQVLKAMGAGAGLITLAGLTGCTSFLESETGATTKKPHLITAQEVMDWSEETKISWKLTISDYVELECHQPEELMQFKDSLLHAQSSTTRFADMLEASGISRDLDKHAALVADNPNAVDFDAVVKHLQESIDYLADGKEFLEGDRLLGRLLRDFMTKSSLQRSLKRILKQGGSVKEVRKLIGSLNADKVIEGIKAGCLSQSIQSSLDYEFTPHVITALSSTTCAEACEEAQERCAAFAIIAAEICSASIVFPDLGSVCRAALTLAVAACAAAVLVCKLCSGGGGGVVIEP